MSQGVVGLLILIQNSVDPLAHSVQEANSLLHRSAETLDVGNQGGSSVLGILGAGNGLESASISVTVDDFVGDLDEQAALGGTLSVDSDGGADVASALNILTRLSRDGHVNGRVREGASIGAGEEILDEGAEAVELVGGGVPSEEGLAGGGLESQGEHVLLVFDIDLDLILLLGVRDSKA